MCLHVLAIFFQQLGLHVVEFRCDLKDLAEMRYSDVSR